LYTVDSPVDIPPKGSAVTHATVETAILSN